MTISDIQQTAPWEWGDTEREELIAVLRDPGASVAERALAAELAGETVIVDDEIAGLLLAIARNAEEPEEVRSSAAIGLGPALEEADTAEITNGIVGEVDVDSPISAEVFASIKAGLREVVEDESAPALVRRRALEAAVRAPAPWQRE
jgi:hypothetical protein